MSTRKTPAGRRVLSALLQRLLQALGLQPRTPQSPSAKPKRRPAFAFETLEPRLMMSADLTGSLAGVVVPDHILPADHLNVAVVVQNAGHDASSLTPVVRLYASTSDHVDSQSIVLGESAVKNQAIKAGKSV